MASKLMIQVSRQQLEYWMVMLRNGLPETVSSMIQTVLEAQEAPRQEPEAWKITYADNGELHRVSLSSEQADRLSTDSYYKVTPLYAAQLSPDHSGGYAHNSGWNQIGTGLQKLRKSTGDAGGPLLHWDGEGWVETKDHSGGAGVVLPDVDVLAQIIRTVDGNHSLGAGALAERIIDKVKELNQCPAPSRNLVLTDEQFDQFQKLLKDNPMDENKALQDLLDMKSRWS